MIQRCYNKKTTEQKVKNSPEEKRESTTVLIDTEVPRPLAERVQTRPCLLPVRVVENVFCVTSLCLALTLVTKALHELMCDAVVFKVIVVGTAVFNISILLSYW